MTPLTILYQDPYLVAIDKPADLLVHRSLIDKRETRFALQLVRDQIGQYVYPVHRLDRPTSGVLLFALSSEVARIVSTSFINHEVEKSYYAIVRGYTDAQGLIDYPLKEILDSMSDKQADQNKPAQAAITQYRCLAQAELPFPVGRYQSARYSLQQLLPQTGRNHQLRRHMAHIRHPILGDTTHGDGKQNAFFFAHCQFRRLMLMANRLTLPHPITKAKISIAADFGPEWQAAFALLGWDDLPLFNRAP